MKFGANKTSFEVIREGAFGETYFRDIYSDINGKWYKKSWKEFNQLKNFNQKYYCYDYYDVSVNRQGVKCGKCNKKKQKKNRSLWLISVVEDQKYWLGKRSESDERQINRWKGIVSRFSGKLVKLIKDIESKFDDYSI